MTLVPLAKGDPMHDSVTFGFRFLAGRPLDGRPRSDATFLRSGTKGLGHSGHASRWALRPGWHRTGFRIGALVVATVTVWLFLIAGRVIIVSVLVIAAVFLASGTGWAGHIAFRNAREWRHHRRYVGPVHAKLCSALSLPYRTAGEYLTIPVDFRSEHTDGARIDLPATRHFTAEEEATLREIVARTLGMNDAQTAWHREGNRPHVLMFPAPRPPARLNWSDCEDFFFEATATAPFVGLDKARRPVYADLEADSPHILVSAGSGGGKSALTKVLLAQGLNRGARAVILDFKRVSHRWAQEIPGVDYCKDIGAIHAALVALGAEGDRRNIAHDEGQPMGQRIFLVAEEMNATITKLQLYWEAIREKDDPKRSPAISGLHDVLFMGRQVSMNCIAIAQMMSARTLGGPEARENFATRCLARYSLNAWKMLCPEVWPAPKRSRIVGRWQIVKGGEATETQVPWLTDDEARAWALGGVERPAGLPDTGGTVPDGTELVTLRQAHEELPGDVLSWEAFRKASQRDGFPEPARITSIANYYRRGDVHRWKVRRDGVRMVSVREREAS